MRSVTRLVDIQNRDHQTWPVRVSSNAACRLNVLGAGLWLTEHHHQSQPRNIQANRNHVRCNRDIHMLVVTERESESLLCFRDTSRIYAARQLDRLVVDLPAIKESRRLAFALPVCVPFQAIADFVFYQPSCSTKLTQAVEVPQKSQVWIGRARQCSPLFNLVMPFLSRAKES